MHGHGTAEQIDQIILQFNQYSDQALTLQLTVYMLGKLFHQMHCSGSHNNNDILY